jgi:hypothetical protein
VLGQFAVSRPGNAVGVFDLLHKGELAQLMSHVGLRSAINVNLEEDDEQASLNAC